MSSRKLIRTAWTPFEKTDEAQRHLDQVTNELKESTTQLNAFKPASSQNVDTAQKKLFEDFQQQLAIQSKVSEDVQQKLVAQTVRMDQLSESVNESQKTTQANAELMQTLLAGMENLGEHFKQLQADLGTLQVSSIPGSWKSNTRK